MWAVSSLTFVFIKIQNETYQGTEAYKCNHLSIHKVPYYTTQKTDVEKQIKEQKPAKQIKETKKERKKKKWTDYKYVKSPLESTQVGIWK